MKDKLDYFPIKKSKQHLLNVSCDDGICIIGSWLGNYYYPWMC